MVEETQMPKTTQEDEKTAKMEKLIPHMGIVFMHAQTCSYLCTKTNKQQRGRTCFPLQMLLKDRKEIRIYFSLVHFLTICLIILSEQLPFC